MWTTVERGDLRPAGESRGSAEGLVSLALDIARTGPGTGPRELAWLTQVHGRTVLAVSPTDPAGDREAPEARHVGTGDALAATDPSVALAVLTADCAPVALGSPEGVFAAVHVGWRGLLAGVVEAAVGRMRELGAGEVAAAVGPCVHAGCYEFADAELDRVSAAYGEGVRARTASGRPALDLPVAVGAALDAAGAGRVPGVDTCTACGGGYFSHRARRERGRQAMVVWADGGRSDR